MKLIVFLGNPGAEYKNTRHNLGQIIGDFYAKSQGLIWKTSKKFPAELTEFTSSQDEKILLAKPLVFYNETGDLTQKLKTFYKIDNEDILAVADDLNLPFGRLRTRQQGSDGGNNGLKSMITHLGPDFPRLRLGTHNDIRAKSTDSRFVLSKFAPEERSRLPDILVQAANQIDLFINNQFTSNSCSSIKISTPTPETPLVHL